MKTNVKLLKEMLKIVYVKELLGDALYEHIGEYPSLQEKCDMLVDVATDYELSILERIGDRKLLKEKVIEGMLAVRDTAMSLSLYRQSDIYFHNNILTEKLV